MIIVVSAIVSTDDNAMCLCVQGTQATSCVVSVCAHCSNVGCSLYTHDIRDTLHALLSLTHVLLATAVVQVTSHPSRPSIPKFNVTNLFFILHAILALIYEL